MLCSKRNHAKVQVKDTATSQYDTIKKYGVE